MARLIQEFTGAFHVVGPDGRIARFSMRLRAALDYCAAQGWQVEGM